MSRGKKKIISQIMDIPNNHQKELMKDIVIYAFEFKHVKEVGIGDVRKLTSKKYSDADILLSLQKLCLMKDPLLELKYEVQLDEDQYEKLSIDEYKEAEKSGKFINPNTGEGIDFHLMKDKIFMYFKIKRY